MTEAITIADRIEPETCRAVAHERFSIRRMVDHYFDIYRRIAGASAFASHSSAA
jgi:hypothetical protein